MSKGLFNKINIATGVKKQAGEKNVVVELMKPPMKELIVPKIENFEKNSRHQADVLYLQDDDGYKYCLTVIDTTTRLADARPLKKHDAQSVLQAFKSIYKGKYLKKPTVAIETDPGTEFQGKVSEWIKSQNIEHKVGRTNRHRQVGLAEYLNYVIGRSIAYRQNAEELLTNETSRQWVSDLPTIIKAYNEFVKESKNATVSEEQINEKLETTKTIQCEGASCKLLDVGTRVRVILDRPIATDGKKLHGKFRAGDYRWDKTPRTITKVSLKPGQPPLYTVSGIGNALYTREQLQLIDAQETAPNETAQRKWIVEKIIKRVKKNGRVMYEVKWKNYEEPTIEPRTALMKDTPEMVKEYEKNMKNKK